MVSLNGTLFVQFLNFFILVAILAKFAYKPLLKVMDERRNRIESDLENAKKARIAAEHLQEEYKQHIKKARQDAEEIIDEAKQNAEQLAQAHLTELREQLAREKELAHKEIALERERVISEIRSEVVAISMAVAEKVIRKELTAPVDDSYINDAIAKMDSKGVGLQ